MPFRSTRPRRSWVRNMQNGTLRAALKALSPTTRTWPRSTSSICLLYTSAKGTGAALLGHPLDALLFAVEKRRQLSQGLEAGTFISLGTMTMPQWVERPLQARIEVEGLGAVEVTFG